MKQIIVALIYITRNYNTYTIVFLHHMSEDYCLCVCGRRAAEA